MFDTRKGAALLAVIDSGSFEQAAALLHLTPSAVSQRVSALESELGTPLLVRSKPCRPTRDGQRLLQYLRRSRLLEDELRSDLDGASRRPLSVALAVNNDSVATWLLPALAPFLIAEQILLDITLDDQDHTSALLAQGMALAGVSTQATPMRGCQVAPLGVMRYRLLAAPAFAQRWFGAGFTRGAARLAPLLVFDRKDTLQADFLLRELGLPPDSYPCHFIPASDPFLRALELGLGYGMIPDLQLAGRPASGALIELAPGRVCDVALYWHSWRVQSPKLERLSGALIDQARQILLQP